MIFKVIVKYPSITQRIEFRSTSSNILFNDQNHYYFQPKWTKRKREESRSIEYCEKWSKVWFILCSITSELLFELTVESRMVPCYLLLVIFQV